jgi:hypothetical protein
MQILNLTNIEKLFGRQGFEENIAKNINDEICVLFYKYF